MTSDPSSFSSSAGEPRTSAAQAKAELVPTLQAGPGTVCRRKWLKVSARHFRGKESLLLSDLWASSLGNASENSRFPAVVSVKSGA